MTFPMTFPDDVPITFRDKPLSKAPLKQRPRAVPTCVSLNYCFCGFKWNSIPRPTAWRPTQPQAESLKCQKLK